MRRRYSLVVANIETRSLVPLVPDLLRVTGRRLLLTGILEEHAGELEALSEKPQRVDSQDGWVLYRIDP